jgi:hypothetical protein
MSVSRAAIPTSAITRSAKPIRGLASWSTVGFSFLCGIEDYPPDAEFLLFTTPEIYLGADGAVNSLTLFIV